MSHVVETIFGELGITQYLDTFLEQGFDTWETILDITESDLCVSRDKLSVSFPLLTRLWGIAMRWG